MKRIAVMAAAAMLFVGAGSLYAQQDKSCSDKGKAASCCASKKAALTEYKSVTTDELKSMIDAKSVFVVDARDGESFAAGHINGAVNFADMKLPADKNAKLVFYCGGVKCPAASRAAKKALDEGYKNVMVYRGGWAEWSSNS